MSDDQYSMFMANSADMQKRGSDKDLYLKAETEHGAQVRTLVTSKNAVDTIQNGQGTSAWLQGYAVYQLSMYTLSRFTPSWTVSGQQDGITEAEHGFIGQLLADLAISSSLLDFLILLFHSPCELLQPHLHTPDRHGGRRRPMQNASRGMDIAALMVG